MQTFNLGKEAESQNYDAGENISADMLTKYAGKGFIDWPSQDDKLITLMQGDLLLLVSIYFKLLQ